MMITLLSYILSFKFLSTEMILKPNNFRASGNDTNSNTTNSTSSSSSAPSTARNNSSTSSPQNSTGASASNSSNSTSGNNTSPKEEFKVAKIIGCPLCTNSAMVQYQNFYNSNYVCPPGTIFNQYSGICGKEATGGVSPNDLVVMSGVSKGTAIEDVERYKGYKTPAIVNQIGADWKYYDRKKGQEAK